MSQKTENLAGNGSNRQRTFASYSRKAFHGKIQILQTCCVRMPTPRDPKVILELHLSFVSWIFCSRIPIRYNSAGTSLCSKVCDHSQRLHLLHANSYSRHEHHCDHTLMFSLRDRLVTVTCCSICPSSPYFYIDGIQVVHMDEMTLTHEAFLHLLGRGLELSHSFLLCCDGLWFNFPV